MTLKRAGYLQGAALVVFALLGKSIYAAPQTGLVHSNVPNFIGVLEGTSGPRTWVRPTSETAVLSCPPGTAAADCSWGKPAFAWRKFGDLAADAFVNVCAASIEPGPFAPPDRPSVDPTCGDPCGCGNALDKKTNVLKSAVQLTDTTPVNTTGLISLEWDPVTLCTDPTDNVVKACNDPAHPTWAIQGYRVFSGTSAATLGLLQTVAASVYTLQLPGYGDGTYYFAVTAFNGQGESVKSGIASVEVKKPTTPVDSKAVPASVEGVRLKVTF